MSSLRRSITLVISLVFLGLLAPFTVAATGPVMVEGRLQFAIAEDFAENQPHVHAPGTPDDHGPGTSGFHYSVVTADGGTYRLVFPSGRGPDGFVNGAMVRVRGTVAGGALTVAAEAGSAQVTAEPVAAAATATKSVAVLLVNFEADKTQPWTIATATGTVFTNTNSVARYFDEESDGQLAVTGDVYGYFTIAFDTTSCNYTDLATKAKAAARAASIDLSTYTNIQYAFPKLTACGWAGLAYLPGTESWINNALNLRVSGHELSHNFGVHHASTWSCTEGGVRVALALNTANCTASEYGDPFSIMGSASTRHTHNQQLSSLGWIPTTQRLTVTSSGTYQLGAAEDVSAAVRALRIPRGDGTYLYLEIRRPTGTSFDNFSATDPAVKGVSIRISNDWTSIIQSKLLDTTPATTTFSDAPLAAGLTFRDPYAGVDVTTVAVDALTGAATVSVSWGTDATAPSTPTNLTGSLTSASSVRLSWGASTDNRAVTGYRVSRDGLVLGTVTGTTFDDSGLVPGTYAYAVVALDGAGNASGPATLSFVVPEPDTLAPSSPTNLRVSALTKTKVTLAWGASTDNRAVTGYRIYRGTKLVATVTSLTWTDTRQRTATTYTVYAIDAAGNVSGASNPVSVAAR